MWDVEDAVPYNALPKTTTPGLGRGSVFLFCQVRSLS